VRLERRDEVGVVGGTGAAFGDENFVRKVQISRGGDAGGFGNVGEDNGDFNVGETPFADGFSDGDEVGAAAGQKDAEAEGRALRVFILRVGG